MEFLGLASLDVVVYWRVVEAAVCAAIVISMVNLLSGEEDPRSKSA
jgi:hypothetical protein